MTNTERFIYCHTIKTIDRVIFLFQVLGKTQIIFSGWRDTKWYDWFSRPPKQVEHVKPARQRNQSSGGENVKLTLNASSSYVMACECGLQKTVVISFCTLELTPPMRYSPSVLIPARQSKSSAFKYSETRPPSHSSNRLFHQQHVALTSHLHQVDALPHKVEPGLIKIRCGTRREQQRTKAQINCQLTDAAD